MPNIIPVLQTSINKLTHPRDIMKSILRWYMYNPANINDSFHELEISFIYDSAEATTIDMLSSMVTKHLEDKLQVYFPEAAISVDVDHTMVDDKRFDLTIDMIVNIDGNRYEITQNYNTDENGNLDYNAIE